MVESGVGAGNTPIAGDDFAGGNVLTDDTDADLNDSKAVAGVEAGLGSGPITTGVGDTIVGTYGTLVLTADGNWTYTLNNNGPDTQALVQDQHVSDVFTYTMEDSQNATSTTTLTIAITGTNDAPTLAAVTGATYDDTAAANTFTAATGTLVGADVDHPTR